MKTFVDTGAFYASAISADIRNQAAVAFMDAFEESDISLLRVSAAIETRAKNIFRKLDTPRLSFFDCTSFALINAHSLDHAFSFDSHFSFFRFNHPVIILDGRDL